VHKYWNPLHVTMRAVRGLPSFRAQMLFAAFERAVRTTRRGDFRIVELSVQDDHLHLIVEAEDDGALARGMKSFSVRANRLFNAAFGRGRGRVWGDRYHRRDLTNARQVRNALIYCLANYKEHQGVTSGAPRIDPCSSARWFQGWTAIRRHDDAHARRKKRAPCCSRERGTNTASSIPGSDQYRRADDTRRHDRGVHSSSGASAWIDGATSRWPSRADEPGAWMGSPHASPGP
jgi:REP element-mobilizing transposase RayT